MCKHNIQMEVHEGLLDTGTHGSALILLVTSISHWFPRVSSKSFQCIGPQNYTWKTRPICFGVWSFPVLGKTEKEAPSRLTWWHLGCTCSNYQKKYSALIKKFPWACCKWLQQGTCWEPTADAQKGSPVGPAALSFFGFAQSLIIIRHVLSFLEIWIQKVSLSKYCL